MARKTFSDVIEKWFEHNGGGYNMYEAAPEGLLYDLDVAGFAVVRKVTPEDLAGDDG